MEAKLYRLTYQVYIEYSVDYGEMQFIKAVNYYNSVIINTMFFPKGIDLRSNYK